MVTSHAAPCPGHVDRGQLPCGWEAPEGSGQHRAGTAGASWPQAGGCGDHWLGSTHRGDQGSGQAAPWVMSRTPAGAPELPRLIGFFSEGGTPPAPPPLSPSPPWRSPGACWARRCSEPKARDLGPGVWGGPGVRLPPQRLAGSGSGQQEPLWRSQGGQGCQGPWWGSIPPRLVFVNLSFN